MSNTNRIGIFAKKIGTKQDVSAWENNGESKNSIRIGGKTTEWTIMLLNGDDVAC